MRKLIYILPIFLLCILWSSCRKDFEFETSTGNLSFSKDTVFLDTVFTNIGSSTYSLKVYNRSKKDISIPSITLANGANSSYRINVDGVAGNTFNDVSLFAKDSLFIFIETTFDISTLDNNEFLYTDAIVFGALGTTQEVPLVTLVKDAVFLYPNQIGNGTKETVILGIDDNGENITAEGFSLTNEQLNFTNDKPYVIYGYAIVPPTKLATVAAGTRIHFHKDSGILVKENATIHINGELSTDPEILEKEVIFEGDRLEPEFSDVPGQWGAIWLAKGSLNNTIDYLTIKNATIALFTEGDETIITPTLTIKNSQIYNSTRINLWGKTATIVGENLVLGSAENASLYCNLGGSYSFTHCTIANYWNASFRERAALQINNFNILSSGKNLVRANFTNCIIDGNKSSELTLNSNNTNTFNYNFTNCLIKYSENNSNPLYDFTNTIFYKEIFLNLEAGFIDTSKNNFRITEESDAINNALLEAALAIPLDILGKDRTTNPDIGAYKVTIEN